MRYITNQEQLESVKAACRIAFLESRKFEGSQHHKERYLDVLLESIFKDAFAKVESEDNTEIQDETREGFFGEVKELMQQAGY